MPSAIFWIWVVGLIAMALKYSKTILNIHTREKRANDCLKGSATQQIGVPAIVSTIIVQIITAFVIMGGMKNLVTVTDKLVPFMTIIYLAAGLIVIGINIENLIPALKSIFASALSGTAATGGFSGAALSAAIKNGCSRGVYSSDVGNGSASIAYAQSDVKEPVEQGM